MLGALILMLIAIPAALTLGSTDIPWQSSVRILGSRVMPFWISIRDLPRTDAVIVWMIRVPRIIIAGTIGAGLALAGTLMQGLFRNPLAESNIVGVSGGAVLGAVLVITSGLTAKSVFILPIASFGGALLALAVVYAIATRGGVTPMSTLLLTGVAIAALLGAASSLVLSMNVVNFNVLEQITFWMMGGLDNRSWTHVWLSVPFMILAGLVSWSYATDLDLLMQGEETAAALGVDVETTKRMIMLTAALLTGTAVAVAGAVGFVGLIVPHIARKFVGPAHRILLPASALAGASFLVICDLLARTVIRPQEIRLGIVTAAFGAPFFLVLLVRKFREMN